MELKNDVIKIKNMSAKLKTKNECCKLQTTVGNTELQLFSPDLEIYENRRDWF